MNRVSTEEVLNKAYRLAYFLHQDKGVATRIVANATLKLNVAMAVQSKRLYYIPVGRFSRGESRRTDGIRSKALFSDLHLLQRLIYGESEPYEREKERAASATPLRARTDVAAVSEDDLLVYFIKHLVRITTKRNAFYVTLGVSRLLHSYSTLETMEIYNAVIGEPERVKDDYYYRSRKAVLMHEMYQRFGELIRACRQRRGEERFETQPGSSEQRSLVRECLRLFTPWDTQCTVPHDFDPFKSVIASLTSRSSADENEIEVNRIHAVLHPECFERLIAAFGYRSPAERMELPRFFMDQMNDQSPPGPRSAPSELSAEELAEINQSLVEQAGRRRRSSPAAVIRIMVDGVERGRLNPAQQSSVSFNAEEDAEIIEVKTSDPRGDLLLATYLLTAFEKDADEAAIVSSITLEGGQELSLSITRRSIEASGGADLLVQFGYRETNPRRAVRLWWRRLMLRLRPQQELDSRGWWGGRISTQPVIAGAVLVIFLASLLGYMRWRSRETNGPVQTTAVDVTTPGPERSNEATNPPGNEAVAKATVNEPNRNASQPTPQPNRDTAAKTQSSPVAVDSPTDEDVAEDAVRSGNVVTNLTLGDVKKIYIDVRGAAASNELQTKLIDSLNSSGDIIATMNPGDADSSLKIAVAPSAVSARLVNARGTVLWPKGGGARRYSGETGEVVSQISRDLVSEIRLARARQ